MKLLDAMLEEQSIWQNVYSYSDTACPHTVSFFTPDFPDHPHWNIVYPRHALGSYHQKDLKSLLDFYDQKGCIGHIYARPEDYHAKVVSEDEFFIFEKSQKKFESTLPRGLTIKETDDLQSFSKVVVDGFSLDKSSIKRFIGMMETIKASMPTTFLLAYWDQKPIGSLASFTTKGGYNYLINGCVLTDYRQKKIMTHLLSSMMNQVKGTALTHSNNMHLRNTLLPKLGFTSLGATYVHKIKDIVK